MADPADMDDLFNLRAAFPDEEEKKAFFKAARNNDIPALEKMLQKWPDAASKWYDDGKPVLLSTYSYTTPETVAFLISKGADVNQTDAKGNWTPLIMAAFLGTAKDVEKFLRAGAPVDGEDKCGRTPLAMAVDQSKDMAVIDMLVIFGADPSHKGTWQSKTIMQEAKTDEVREVIKSAQARREAFLKGQKVKPPGPAEPAPAEPAVPESEDIKLLNRIVLRKDGEDAPAPKIQPPAPAKQGWWKKLGL